MSHSFSKAMKSSNSLARSDNSEHELSGAGLGLRREIMSALEQDSGNVDFMEVAPENWMHVGGRLGKAFRSFTERLPFVCHGLSLSIGSPDPLDESFVKQVKEFLDNHGVLFYSEHLSYCGDHGHMYDLMPIPFTEQAARYVSERIKRVQDILNRPLVIENVSAYAFPSAEMSELEFLNLVLQQADCQLLLDVNNVYVNSINHSYNPFEFIEGVPSDKIVYHHIAGHYEESETLLVDTHGAPVKPDVWSLLRHSYQVHGVKPTLLERDFNFPPMSELFDEVGQIKSLQASTFSHPGMQHG